MSYDDGVQMEASVNFDCLFVLKCSVFVFFLSSVQQCGAGMVATNCMSPCDESNTCHFLADGCDVETTECVPGCECMEGTYFDGKECVPIDECNCVYKGQIVEVRSLFLSFFVIRKSFLEWPFMLRPTLDS